MPRFTGFTRRFRRPLAASAIAAAFGSIGLATAASASTSSVPAPVYSKIGSYQFASNYQDGSSYPFVVSNSPLTYADANQSLGASGVALSVSGSPSYSSSAVIVDLGKLSTLFNASGDFVPPAIVGSPNLQYNLYFDTNGDGSYFGWDNGAHDPYVYEGMDGDNAACMGAANNTSDNADFTCFSGQGSGAGLSGQMTMEQVKAAFAARTDSGTTNPEVWAWIGIQTTPDATGYVTSVDGTALVKTTQPTGEVKGSGGKCLDVYNNLAKDGTKAQVWTCLGDRSQQWYLTTAGALVHGSSGYCLDDTGNKVTAGNKVQIWTCNGDRAQAWAYGGKTLRHGGMCLDAGSGANGTQVVLEVCDGKASQDWSQP